MALTKEQERVLADITPRDGFAYFAGREKYNFAHAAIYFGNGKFNVVGMVQNGDFIEVECDTLDEAAEEWKKLFANMDLRAMMRWNMPEHKKLWDFLED